MRDSRSSLVMISLLLLLPVYCLGGQTVVALHRKNAQLDAVASRASKNVAVRLQPCPVLFKLAGHYLVYCFKLAHDASPGLQNPRAICNAYVRRSSCGTQLVAAWPDS